jgi:hypothetical protein
LSGSGHSPVERAILAILRPLLKVALRRGVAHGRFSDLAKEAYVDVARDHFSAPGRKPTASRISILTGLTRRDVARLVKGENEGAQESPRTRFNRAARVLGAWASDPKYLDGRGGPASLSYESESGPSIIELVRDHGADVPPRAVLEELLAVGAVRRLKNGQYRPVQRSYIPQLGDEAKLEILGMDVADLISSIDHNLDPDLESPYYQRKVSYDNLPASYLPKLRALVEKEAQRLLEQLNRDMAKQDRDVQTPSKRKRSTRADRSRAMIGVYFYQDKVDDDE